MVTTLQEEQIRQLRSQGVGYRQIANQLNLSRDTVRNYCKANNLNGYREAVQANIQRMLEDDEVCTYCGSLLEQPRTGRKKHFCNDTCRRKWWNQNRDKITLGCCPSAIPETAGGGGTCPDCPSFIMGLRLN